MKGSVPLTKREGGVMLRATVDNITLTWPVVWFSSIATNSIKHAAPTVMSGSGSSGTPGGGQMDRISRSETGICQMMMKGTENVHF